WWAGGRRGARARLAGHGAAARASGGAGAGPAGGGGVLLAARARDGRRSGRAPVPDRRRGRRRPSLGHVRGRRLPGGRDAQGARGSTGRRGRRAGEDPEPGKIAMTNDRLRGHAAAPLAIAAFLAAAPGVAAAQETGAHTAHHGAAAHAPSHATAAVPQPRLPAGAADARERLAASPRHAEWVMVATGPADSVRAWVVYPERPDRAPVVLVVHEIYGLTDWIRAVADQLAAEGFIAIAPDLLTMKNVPADPATGEPSREAAVSEIRTLDPDDVHRQLRAVAEYGMGLPAATRSYGIVGFCWGGAVSFAHAVRVPELGAA